MGWGRLRERLEQLLRESHNFYGPSTGRGYDYLHAGMTVAAFLSDRVRTILSSAGVQGLLSVGILKRLASRMGTG